MKKEPVIIDYKMLRPDFPAYGQSMACYVCGKQHGALNVARISDEKKTTNAPLCETCVRGDPDAVIRKYLKVSDLEIHEVTEEQVVGLEESTDTNSM